MLADLLELDLLRFGKRDPHRPRHGQELDPRPLLRREPGRMLKASPACTLVPEAAGRIVDQVLPVLVLVCPPNDAVGQFLAVDATQASYNEAGRIYDLPERVSTVLCSPGTRRKLCTFREDCFRNVLWRLGVRERPIESTCEILLEALLQIVDCIGPLLLLHPLGRDHAEVMPVCRCLACSNVALAEQITDELVIHYYTVHRSDLSAFIAHASADFSSWHVLAWHAYSSFNLPYSSPS